MTSHKFTPRASDDSRCGHVVSYNHNSSTGDIDYCNGTPDDHVELTPIPPEIQEQADAMFAERDNYRPPEAPNRFLAFVSLVAIVALVILSVAMGLSR